MPDKVRPIRPDEVEDEKQRTFPKEVFESFNELITQKFSSGHATIKQDDVVELMVKKGLKEEEIFVKGWLDVEAVYRKEGWEVKYDKPGYNESYPAIFEFKRPRK